MSARKLAVNVILLDPATAAPRVFTAGSQVPAEFADQITNDAVYEAAEDTPVPAKGARGKTA